MRAVFARAAVLLALVAAPAIAADAPAKPDKASPAGPCATPRAAAATYLDNLQPDQLRPDRATLCFDAPAGMSSAELQKRVRDLKAVLDARGLWVVMEDLPDAADHRDDRGRARAALVERLPEVELRKAGGAWRFPPEVVERIPGLHAATFSGWIDGVLHTLPSFFRAKVLDYEAWQLLGLLLLVLLSTVGSRLVRALVERRLPAWMKRWGVVTTGETLSQLARPLGWLAGAAAFAVLLPELRFAVGTARVLSVALRLVAAVAGVLVAYRLVDVAALRLEQRAIRTEGKMDDQLVMLVRKAAKTVVVAVGIIFVLQNLSVDVTSLLAGLGIGGLALALAAKDTAANVFGSVALFLDGPFYVGDWIVAAGVEGTVVEMGLRSTRILTFYNSVISVPNSVLAVANIDNMSRREYRRYTTRLAIAYHTTPAQVEAFVEGIRAIIAGHPDTRKDYYEVHFVEFGPSALQIMVYTFFKVATWSDELQAKHQLNLEFIRLAESLGVEFAFPTQTLHVATRAEPRPVAPHVPPDEPALTAAVQSFGPGGERARPRGRMLTHGYFAGQETARGPDESEG